MALPAYGFIQLNNVLARMDSFEFCPGCQRVLYRKELIDGVVEPAAEN